MFLYLLIIVLIIVAIIWLPKLFRRRVHDESSTAIETFNLSPLEASILRDIQRVNITEPRAQILYLFCLKPVRADLKARIAAEIVDFFPRGSEAHQHLLEFQERYEQDRIEELDQMYRAFEARRHAQPAPATPPPQPAAGYPRRMSPLAPPAPPRRQRETRPHAPPPQPAPRARPRRTPIHNPFEGNRELDDLMDMFGEMEFVAQMRAFEQFDREATRRRTRHVYENTQNVHSLNTECLKKAHKLAMKYKARSIPEEIEKEISLLLLNAPVGKTEAIAAALDRIREDKSAYGYDGAAFTMSQLFYAVVMYIKSEAAKEAQSELQKRLYEELEESGGKCGTGHVVRLLNVLQGFEPEYEMKLPIKDEIYARLSILAQRHMEQSPEMDEILADNDALIRFLQTKHEELLRALLEEYREIASPAEVEKCVADALNRYTKSTVFLS